MNIDQNKLNLLKQAVELSFGRTPASPYDFDSLSIQIQTATNEKLSISTLKRFWGYVNSSHTPTYTTLSVLARYAGCRDWNSFCAQHPDEEDSGFSNIGIVNATDVALEAVIRVEWAQNKSCTIRKVGQPNKFEVVEAQNIKLNKADTLTVDTLSVGEKFFAKDCCRAAVSLGNYIGARREGVCAIHFIDDNETPAEKS